MQSWQKKNLQITKRERGLSVAVSQPLDPPPVKSVKISEEDPVVIPDPR